MPTCSSFCVRRGEADRSRSLAVCEIYGCALIILLSAGVSQSSGGLNPLSFYSKPRTGPSVVALLAMIDRLERAAVISPIEPAATPMNAHET